MAMLMKRARIDSPFLPPPSPEAVLHFQKSGKHGPVLEDGLVVDLTGSKVSVWNIAVVDLVVTKYKELGWGANLNLDDEVIAHVVTTHIDYLQDRYKASLLDRTDVKVKSAIAIKRAEDAHHQRRRSVRINHRQLNDGLLTKFTNRRACGA